MVKKKYIETVSLNIRISKEINNILQKESENRGISKNELTKMILYKTKDVLDLFYPTFSIDTIKQNLLKEQMNEYNSLEKRKNKERRVKNIKVENNSRIATRRSIDIKNAINKEIYNYDNL